ncbi:S8 family serine peptidase [Trueperella pecoris]|uniref:S8 family serine peptidase n=1 Tax=Trueperella pecoris TaxID=2733571 RepID=A0A7M1R428_9ACTO|nr:S8 family serine peptidase [Trueperella pecoris]QOR48267.1 S8 family serine peptidase [Trueperella pecoris]
MSKHTHRTLIAACVGTGALLFSAFAAQPVALATANEESPILSGEVVVKYKDGTEAAEAIEDAKEPEQAHEKLPADEKERIKEAVQEEGANLADAKAHADGAVTISLDKKLSESDIDSLVEKLEDSKDVEFVEPVYIAQPFQINQDEVNRGKYTSYQWSLRNGVGGINADAAWRYSKGKDVTVAVLDTGIVDHPEFDNKLVQGADLISDSSRSRDGDGRDMNPRDEGDWMRAYECVTWPARARTSSWHGTHVAGIVGATQDEQGIDGVAPQAKILPVRVLGRCGGTSTDIADGITWASGGDVPGLERNENPAKVINLSLGGGPYQCPQVYQNAIDAAIARGSTIVVAAGNEHANARDTTPANCRGVITVGATGPDGEQSSYSNYGHVVDLSAPGGNGYRRDQILSAANMSTTTPTDGNYVWMQGTSQATPHVSGVAALMLSKFPQMTPEQVRQSLVNSTKDVQSCPRGGCGRGILNAPAALEYASNLVGQALTEDDAAAGPTQPVEAPVAQPAPAQPVDLQPAPRDENRTTQRARMTIERWVLDAGQSTAVLGNGFEPGEEVIAYVDSFSRPLGSSWADGQGQIRAQFTPSQSLRVGYHVMFLTGQTSGKVAGARFFYWGD